MTLNITELTVNKCSITPAHLETNQYTCCDVISCALRHAHTYPMVTHKGVADLCLYQLQCTCKYMCIPVLRISCYVAIDSYS